MRDDAPRPPRGSTFNGRPAATAGTRCWILDAGFIGKAKPEPLRYWRCEPQRHGGTETSQRRTAKARRTQSHRKALQSLGGRCGPSEPSDYRRNHKVAGRTLNAGQNPPSNPPGPIAIPTQSSSIKAPAWPTQYRCYVLCDGLSVLASLRFNLSAEVTRVDEPNGHEGLYE